MCALHPSTGPARPNTLTLSFPPCTNNQAISEFGVISEKDVSDLFFADTVEEAFDYLLGRLTKAPANDIYQVRVRVRSYAAAFVDTCHVNNPTPADTVVDLTHRASNLTATTDTGVRRGGAPGGGRERRLGRLHLSPQSMEWNH